MVGGLAAEAWVVGEDRTHEEKPMNHQFVLQQAREHISQLMTEAATARLARQAPRTQTPRTPRPGIGRTVRSAYREFVHSLRAAGQTLVSARDKGLDRP